jgi:hypothetical protein
MRHKIALVVGASCMGDLLYLGLGVILFAAFGLYARLLKAL